MADSKNVIKGLRCCRWGMCFACPYNDGVHGNTGCKTKLVDDALALLEAQDRQWTPITFRPLTDEEKAEHPDWCYIIDSPTPDDGEEILVSDGRYVWADAWYNNGVECYLESDHELEGVAWMKMPTPWKREATPWQGH